MRDCDMLKLKVQDILRESLADEEFMRVSIKVEKSAEDLRKEVLYSEAVIKAQIVVANNTIDAKNALVELKLQELAKYVGIPSLFRDPFTESLADYLAQKGELTKKQSDALLKRYK